MKYTIKTRTKADLLYFYLAAFDSISVKDYDKPEFESDCSIDELNSIAERVGIHDFEIIKTN